MVQAVLSSINLLSLYKVATQYQFAAAKNYLSVVMEYNCRPDNVLSFLTMWVGMPRPTHLTFLAFLPPVQHPALDICATSREIET